MGKRGDKMKINVYGNNEFLSVIDTADLRGADLQGANLRGADLRNAYLRDADLRDADLQGANLQGADLRNTNLQGADLRGADLDYACWPLWCGSLAVTIDNKIANQLLYHMISVIGTNKFTPDQIADANKFHRVVSGECPMLMDIRGWGIKPQRRV